MCSSDLICEVEHARAVGYRRFATRFRFVSADSVVRDHDHDGQTGTSVVRTLLLIVCGDEQRTDCPTMPASAALERRDAFGVAAKM